jgi:hypothetical protein
MRAPIEIATFVAAALLAGCCAQGAYPAYSAHSAYSPYSAAAPPPFDAFQASMRLQVGMPADVAIAVIGWTPASAEVKSCGILAGYEWPCRVLKFGCCESNQLLVFVAPSPDGRGAVNSWSVRKS